MRIRYHFNSNRSSLGNNHNNSVRSIRNSGFIHRRHRRTNIPEGEEDSSFGTMNDVHFHLRQAAVSSSSSGDDDDDVTSSDQNHFLLQDEDDLLLDEVLEAGLMAQNMPVDFGQMANRRQLRRLERRAANTSNLTIRSIRRSARRQRSIITALGDNGSSDNNNVTSYFTFVDGDPLVTSSSGQQNLPSTATNVSQHWGADDHDDNINNNGNNNALSTVTAENNANSDEDEWDAILNTEDITQLTTRLRCLFALLTCPIVPLAAALTLLLLWVLYSALLLDWGQPCDQPLRVYALLSAAMFAYTPHHRTAKRILFGYLRERDGPLRPWGVRVYDQVYHASCLLWMYAGISWTSHSQTCAQTCPHLFRSTKIFVLVQTTFMSILVIPLLCLPCIYLWLVRQAAVISNNRRLLRRMKRVPPEKIMASFITIDLSNANIRQFLEGKECCICMSDLMEDLQLSSASTTTEIVSTAPESVENNNNLASGNASANNNHSSIGGAVGVVQTQCGHLFHKACIATWLNTPYSGSCKCPLCREDLIPPGLENLESQEGASPLTLAVTSSNEEGKEEDVPNIVDDTGEQRSLIEFDSNTPLLTSSQPASWSRMAGSSSNTASSRTGSSSFRRHQDR